MIEVNVKKRLFSGVGEVALSVNFSIQEGEFISITGRSGAGKTTLLKILSGLVLPDEGTIRVNDEVWFDGNKKINVVPQKRKIGFVFQDYALFPNMSVRQNLAFAASRSDSELIDHLLEITGLQHFASRSPLSLSGGQKQRVALARAVVRRPEILLMDEALSALDEENRAALQNEIKKIHQEFRLTTVMVSHDKKEMYKLSDRILELDMGKVVADFSTVGPQEEHAVISSLRQEGEDLLLEIISDKGKIKVRMKKEELAKLKKG